MRDFDDDLALRAEFARFGDDVRAAAPQQDFTRVRTIARRRRTTRAVVIGVVAALVLGVPMAAFAIVGTGTHRHPVNPPPTSIVDNTTPAPSPSTGPSASPSATPGAPAHAQITPEELAAAGVTLPPWTPSRAANCPRKITSFTTADRGVTVMLYVSAQVDVDRDGNPEVVGWFRCLGTVGQPGSSGDGEDSQVVAFTRDGTGAIVVLGQVVTTFDGPVKGIGRIAASGTDVSVDVRDWYCCGTGVSYQQQTRTYRWDGQRFNQSDGPRSFPDNPTLPRLVDLALTSNNLVYSAPVNGQRTGTLRFTVTNRGPDRVDGVKFTFAMDPYAVRDSAGHLNGGPWTSHCTVAGGGQPAPAGGLDSLTCTFAKVIGKGGSAGFQVTFTAPESAVTPGGGSAVDVVGTAPGTVVEATFADNRAGFDVLVS
jgi:hypothetical protein